jgi:cytochrome c
MPSARTCGRACALALAGACFFAAERSALGEAAAWPKDAATLAQGRALLAQYQCGSCHAIPGVEGAQGHAAGTLATFGRRSYIAGRLPNVPEALAAWIVAPQSMVPGTTMPAMGVSAADADLMATYLLSLR